METERDTNGSIVVEDRAARQRPRQDEREDRDEAGVGEVIRLLKRAATRAVKLGVNLEGYMTAAYGMYLQANPAVREQIESEQFVEDLEELRRHGKVGIA